MPLGAARFGLLGGVADLGKLELIETQTITTTTANVDFTDLGNYNVHFLTYNNAETDTDTKTIFARLSNNGGSSFIASGYQYANQVGNSNGTFVEDKNTSAIGMSFSNFYGTGSNERGNGYCFFYNLLDSSKYSFTTSHHTMFDANPYYRFGFGSSVLPTAETHNAIRLTQSLGNIATLDVSLYGIRYS